MSDILVTTTNLDLTEGRGTAKPIVVHRHVGNAEKHGRRAGVMGTHSGVSVREARIGGLVSRYAALHGTLNDLAEVIGHYRDGIGYPRWGIIPAKIEKLTEDEKKRLNALTILIGEIPDKPRRKTPAENGGVIAVWAGFHGSVAGKKTREAVPQILGFINDINDVEEIVRQAREINPNISQIHATYVNYGKPFTLSAETAEWSEKVGIEALPEPDQAALIAEYEALMRKAGIR